jgi:hypothetical protein
VKAFVCALFSLLSGGLLVSAAATAQVGAGSAPEQLILPQEGALPIQTCDTKEISYDHYRLAHAGS